MNLQIMSIVTTFQLFFRSLYKIYAFAYVHSNLFLGSV